MIIWRTYSEQVKSSNEEKLHLLARFLKGVYSLIFHMLVVSFLSHAKVREDFLIFCYPLDLDSMYITEYTKV